MRNRECEIVDQKSFAKEEGEITGISIRQDVLIATFANRNEIFMWRLPIQNQLYGIPENLHDLSATFKLPDCEISEISGDSKVTVMNTENFIFAINCNNKRLVTLKSLIKTQSQNSETSNQGSFEGFMRYLPQIVFVLALIGTGYYQYNKITSGKRSTD